MRVSLQKAVLFAPELRLFLALCRAHRLPWSQRWLLWQLARAQRLRDPARLFLEPERFEPGALPPVLRIRSPELSELRARLFAVPIEAQ